MKRHSSGIRVPRIGELKFGGDRRTHRIPFSVVSHVFTTDGNPATWALHEEDEDTKPLPTSRRCGKIALTHVRGDEGARGALGSRLAIAYILGGDIMAGLVPPKDVDLVLAKGYAMPLGDSGDLRTTSGLLYPSTWQLYVPSKAVAAGSVMDIADFPEDGIIYTPR